MSSRPRFREVQRFRQRWLWALLGGTFLLTLVFVPFSLAGTALLLGVAVVVYSVRLTTEVRGDGIYVRFSPIHRSFRRVPWSAIGSYEATRYGALGEFGGWGIRWRPGAVAYNVSGDEGVRIERHGERAILIGSQRAEEFVAAIDAERSRAGRGG